MAGTEAGPLSEGTTTENTVEEGDSVTTQGERVGYIWRAKNNKHENMMDGFRLLFAFLIMNGLRNGGASPINAGPSFLLATTLPSLKGHMSMKLTRSAACDPIGGLLLWQNSLVEFVA
ncbi:hypothetical protein EGR_03507 [Echinococcus granulosus]|uniref:Uncharacterized protein n=1 Tax=Echinococcus granulosus TaxID=6210 RepID=W6UKT7_ECHGR|nr:hypothetical protein EGR_03507 [Echinococcus granulosus]EUB61693.1 hypothetical protein EGR_03507 [Echinococcus granulosus]